MWYNTGMHRRHKHDIIIVLALIGFGVSMFLAVSHYLGYLVPCDITHGCEAVLNSKYASFVGLPLSVWGAAFFVGVILSSLLANHYILWRRLLSILLGLGALGSLALLIIQFFVIKKVCQWCFTTDVLTIIMFLWDLNIEHKERDELQLTNDKQIRNNN